MSNSRQKACKGHSPQAIKNKRRRKAKASGHINPQPAQARQRVSDWSSVGASKGLGLTRKVEE